MAKRCSVIRCPARRQFLLIAAWSGNRPADARKLACRIMLQLREKRVSRALLYFSADAPITHGFLLNLIDYLHLNNYRFDRYLRKKSKPVQRLDLLCRKKTPLPAADISDREMINRSVVFCRDLVNEIPAKITPDALVQTATALAREHQLALNVFRKAELAEHGLNGLLAVGAAACCSPALIRLDYVPEKFSRTVSLVGKGITFDSGGLNIKPGNQHGRDEMRHGRSGRCPGRHEKRGHAAPAGQSNRPGGRGRKHARRPGLQTRRHHHLCQQKNR